MATNKQKVNSSNSQNLHKIDGKFTLYNTNRQVPTVYFSSLKSLNRKVNLNNLIGLKSTIINISYTLTCFHRRNLSGSYNKKLKNIYKNYCDDDKKICVKLRS